VGQHQNAVASTSAAATATEPAPQADRRFANIGEELNYIHGTIEQARHVVADSVQWSATDYSKAYALEFLLCPLRRVEAAVVQAVTSLGHRDRNRVRKVLVKALNPVATLHPEAYANETTPGIGSRLFRKDPNRSAKRAHKILHREGAPPFPTVVEARTLMRVVAKEMHRDSPRDQARTFDAMKEGLDQRPSGGRTLRHVGHYKHYKDYDFEKKHPTLTSLDSDDLVWKLPAQLHDEARDKMRVRLNMLRNAPAPSASGIVEALRSAGVARGLDAQQADELRRSIEAALAPRSPAQVDALVNAVQIEVQRWDDEPERWVSGGDLARMVRYLPPYAATASGLEITFEGAPPPAYDEVVASTSGTSQS
jgi:hypothetical protein